MKNKKETKKLQLIIEQIVSEELSGLNESDFYKQDILYQAFMEPFADIIDTARAETTKLTTVAFQNVKKLATQSAILAIPFISIDGIKRAEEEANEAIKERIAEVDAQYKDVYQRTWDALKSRDVLGLGFLLGPHLAIGKALGANWALGFKLAKDSPKALFAILEILSGGHPKVIEARKAYEEKIKAIVPGHEGYTTSGNRWNSSGGGLGGGFGYDGGGYDFGGGFGDGGGFGGESVHSDRPVLSEQQQAQQQGQSQPTKDQQLENLYKSMATTAQKLATDPSVQASMAKSPMTKQFQAAGVKAISNTLKPILSVKNFDQLKRALGPEGAKMEAEMMKTLPDEEATPEQMEQFKAEFVNQVKQNYKTMFAAQIQKSAGMDPASQKLVGNIVKQIKS